jgi:ATP-dependent RNA helicase DeaD
MENFLSFGLPDLLINSLAQLQFVTPTPIQAQVIPLALEGKDILGSAQTGTGKTGAFGIPLITHLLRNPQARALVIVPTRELAIQVTKMLESMLGRKDHNIRSALLIGGEAIFKQFKQLQANPRLIVGTPGRINDHLGRRSLKLNEVNFLVLDEADRMLDMGFTPQIDQILEFVPKTRQTLLFSATMPRNILIMSEKYLNKPERISVSAASAPAENLKQDVLYVSEEEKYGQLTSQLETREGSIIIFVKTKLGADRIAKRLRQEKHSADAIHGDLRHHKRERVIKGFRDSKYRILVATDIAARGLDIAHVKHVINYDLPQCPEDYIHRVGRTARAGAEGSALCLIAPADRGKWRAITRLIDPNAAPERDSGSRDRSGARRGKSNASSGYKGGFRGGMKKTFGSAAPKRRERTASNY